MIVKHDSSLKLLTIASVVSFGISSMAMAQSLVTVPPANVQSMLIKNTLTALNHANISGNYTVLRDLASTEFQKRHKASDLSDTFRYLRVEKIDLSPVLVSELQLSQLPVLTPDGRLRLIGSCPTNPLAVQFDLHFQHVGAGWMIDEIALSLASQQPPPQQQVTQQIQPVQQYTQPVNQVRQNQQPTQATYIATGQPSYWQKTPQPHVYPPPNLQGARR